MKIALIDLDGVVADNSIRANKAHEAKADFLGEEALWNKPAPDKQKEAEQLFWKTMFTPELVDLDVPMDGVAEALNQIEKRHNYRVMFFTSRPESMRAATLAWLYKHYLAVDSACIERAIIMKARGFQYVKTVVWKVGMIQQIALLFEADSVLFVDDEENTRVAMSQAQLEFNLIVAGSLPEAVKVLGE